MPGVESESRRMRESLGGGRRRRSKISQDQQPKYKGSGPGVGSSNVTCCSGAVCAVPDSVSVRG